MEYGKNCFNYGASTKIVKMLRAIYEKVQSCVRNNGHLSDFLDSYSGVKQGEALSPLLFILSINDMYENLVIQDDDAFTLNDLKIFILLFADDTVLISYAPHGLQNLIDQLQAYCTKWGITVYTDKTVVMVFKQGNRVKNIDIYCRGKHLNVVAKFSYLGITISSNVSFYHAQKSLANQSSRAFFHFLHFLIKLNSI